MKRILLCAAILTSVAPTHASQADLTNVRSLYASASYDEALTELDKLDADSWSEQVDEYRALCLIAIGREREAEQALEHLVRLSPLHSMTSDRMSPRVIALFETVRARTIPAVARELYAKARSSYEGGRFDAAVSQFLKVAELLSDPALVEKNLNLAEMKELSEGFVEPAKSKLKAPEPPPVHQPVETPMVPAATRASEPSGPQLFTVEDRDVVPPVALSRTMPRWTPGFNPGGPRSLRGMLDIVTDSNGDVESVKLVNPLSPLYDRLLLAAAKEWKFTPARRNGEPVRYSWVLEVVLNDR
jgi:hypothetical protein